MLAEKPFKTVEFVKCLVKISEKEVKTYNSRGGKQIY